jgi:penicillin-binding protein 2
MFKKYALIDTKQESLLIRKRIYVSTVIIGFIFLILISRVYYLQVYMHDHYITLAQGNRLKVQAIPPIRGLIFSRDGVLLADNRPSYSLELIPERVDNLEDLFLELSEIIKIDATDIERFRGQLKKKRRFENIPLRYNLSDEEVAIISVNRHRLNGVDVTPRMNRYYPLGSNLGHVIGYVGVIDEEDIKTLDTSNYSGTSHIGKLGIEKAYEDLLHGSVGYQQVEVNALGRVIRVLDRTPPIAGKNLYLTIDVSLQNLAVEALDGRKGAIVAINPGDGSVLALVSSPGYDPNPFVNGIDRRSYNQLLSSKDIPLLNRALQGKYPPGSTIKPFYAYAAVSEGIRLENDETWCPGFFRLPGRKHQYRDWKKEGHGHTNLTNAIAQSCDVYFYTLAVDMGVDRLGEALGQFGFGSKTGLDIGGESTGLVPGREWKRNALGQAWYPGETVIMGIGQGSTLVTPMQLAAATAKLSMRGKMSQPHLMLKVNDPINNLSSGYLPEPATPILDEENHAWNEAIHGMVEVVHGVRGTARRVGYGAPYTFAGKSGTAQVIAIPQDEDKPEVERQIPDEFKDHALFIAFAPVNNPKIALAIIVENGGGGSSIAAPIARTLLDHYLVEAIEVVDDNNG